MLGTHRKSRDVEIGEECIDELAPTRFCDEFRSGVKLSCALNQNFCAKFAWKRFEAENCRPKKVKVLYLSGLSKLAAWIILA